MTEQKVIILKGLPASGKTTWANEQVAKSNGKIKRVNKDDLRAMLDNGAYSRPNEEFVLTLRNHIIIEALKDDCSVIVDDTNLNPKHEKEIEDIVSGANSLYGLNVTIERKFFECSVGECIVRDAKRPNPVGEAAIKKMANTWLKSYSIPTQQPKIEPGLPLAIIVDMDGTLAVMGDRSAYDASECDKVDSLNKAVAHIIKVYAMEAVRIIICTGRDEKYRVPTAAFLVKNGVPYYKLFMRPDGDTRKDSEVKRELYDKYIKGQYSVLFALDDRNQMVDMWRKELDIPCFQVNYGDF